MMSEQGSDNPYAGRNHENTTLGTGDIRAVAALVGTAASELRGIDQKNIGDSSFTKALKMDPVEAVKRAVNVPENTYQQPPEGYQQQPITQRPQPPPIPVQEPRINTAELDELRKRVNNLENIVGSGKNTVKFKRGISYDLSTTSIKGNFKNPGDILDIILNEMAKNCKTITLKLCDANKNK